VAEREDLHGETEENGLEEQDEWEDRRLAAESVFTPAAPVRSREFFAGRLNQLQSIADTVRETGRHAIVHGERGVGKTSMANILGEIFPNLSVIRVSADSSDDYATLWRKVFRRIQLVEERHRPGFTGNAASTALRLSETVELKQLDVDTVVTTIDELIPNGVIVIDEFDRIASDETRHLVADTIKNFSDCGSEVTVVLVGVAHDVRSLIGEHPSVERNLRQIPMPRMSRDELKQILDTGFGAIDIVLPPSIRDRIVGLSQGFPHYTHLLGKYTALEAISFESFEVAEEDFQAAVEGAIEDTYESIRAAYQTATMTTTKESNFPAVLLAAALAPEDEHGTFRATDMLEPLREITGRKDYDVPNYTYNLGKLSSSERGDVLEKVGDRRPRYRFRSPLMKPFVLMKGFSDGLISEDRLTTTPTGSPRT
jgi:hypothetical protein